MFVFPQLTVSVRHDSGSKLYDLYIKSLLFCYKCQLKSNNFKKCLRTYFYIRN